jgi:two-component system LytT family sensor kinase
LAIAKRNISWFLPLIASLSLGCQLILLRSFYGLNWTVSLTESIFNTALLSLAIWIVMLFVNNYPIRVGALVQALLVATALSVLVAYGSELALAWWFGNKPDYRLWLEGSVNTRYIIAWLVLAWAASFHVMQKKAETLEKRFLKHKDAAELLRDAELFKLRQQLQPHFLYNSLNSISALVMIQPDKAQEMVGKLSDFLRSSVKREAETLMPIAEELTFIEAYLSIEAVRFGDRLKVHLSHNNLDSALIPPFLLQPLLENAIKFGLYGKTGEVDISVNLTLNQDMLSISISNPYDAEMNPPKGTGFGLEGIRRRLELLYARTDLLEIKREENIFTTILNIPQANA